MGTIVKYTANTLSGVNPVKELKFDTNGYYRCVLGGFNLSNHSGAYYPLLPEVKALFEKGGIVRRRLDAGLCRGEYGHPNVSGLPLEQALQRLMKIEPTMVSHHIKSIELKDSKDEYGKPIILAIGEVKPTGPYGNYVKEQLDNPEENVAFSIRSITADKMIGNQMNKVVLDALTYDYVTEPGIKHATKFNSLSMEELLTNANISELFPGIIFTENDINKAIQTTSRIGLEEEHSTLVMVKERLGPSLGWHKVKVIGIRSLDW